MVEEIKSCSKCKDCERAQQDERTEQESKRIIVIKSLFDKFLKKNQLLLENSVYMNNDLLELVVKSYYDDVYRFKDYTGSEMADRHKQAAFTIKWISKIKPIQIKEGSKANKYILMVNSSFAVFLGFSFFDPVVSKKVSAPFLQHLIYSTLYRNISDKQLAASLYLMEVSVLREQ